MSDRPLIARVTVQERIYHQVVGEQPTSHEPTPYTRSLLTDEQPYGPRKIRVGEEWQSLDSGWLKRCSLLEIVNEEGTGLQVQPSPEEREETAGRIVEVGVSTESSFSATESSFSATESSFSATESSFSSGVPFALVRPGESCRYEPEHLPSVKIRCRKGTARIKVLIIPE